MSQSVKLLSVNVRGLKAILKKEEPSLLGAEKGMLILFFYRKHILQ